ncbi:MAG TPA: hypothetical protein VMN38_11640 [Sphingomicrobium sp.]|nr:hypothetical protein [Sphingomicrobium sp.]
MQLPKSLLPLHIEKAVGYVERETSELIDIYLEQANVFSAIIGIFGTKGLDSFSPYKKHKHPDIAQQRFPDLSLHGKLNPPPLEAVESKGSKRAWDIQSHYDHPGWYVVWRYLVDPTQTIKPGFPVVIWRVDIVFLTAENWTYQKSGAGQGKGGRTHTFGVKNPATVLKGCAAYALPGIALKNSKPILVPTLI